MLHDLNLLRVFDALMHEGKVVAAAARLGLSPPAVSNALGRLRRATGDPLFVRSAQGMLPTPHAQMLAQTVGPALQALQQALASPRAFEPMATERRFRVAMTDIGEIVFLPRLMQVLQAEAPQVAIQTLRNAAAQTRDDMARGGVDLAVGWLPDLDAGFHQRRLFEQRYVCLMAAGHALSRGRMTLDRYRKAQHLVVVAEGTGHDRVARQLRQIGAQVLVPLALPHFVAVPWILRDSPLVATVPLKLAQQVAAPLGLVMRDLPRDLPLDLSPFEVNLFWHERVHRDPGHRWLRERWARLFGAPH